jgi:hypothetical protein
VVTANAPLHLISGTLSIDLLAVSYGGTGVTTLTGYVKGNGTAAMTASATIPTTDISGLGTMAVQNANAVAITGGSIASTVITGLGTMSTQNANAVAITGGTINGIDLDGGTF